MSNAARKITPDVGAYVLRLVKSEPIDHRYRNAPPSDETTATVFCEGCGTDYIDVERERYRGTDPHRQGEYRDVATCLEKDCGITFELDPQPTEAAR